MMNKLIHQNPPHPGKIILEFYLEPLNLNVTEAAVSLCITRPNMSGIVNGKVGISPLMALKLAKAFDTTPMFWMNIQAAYDLKKASGKKRELKKVKVLV